MNRYVYEDRMWTVNELSDASGIAPATIRDRLRRGYTVEEAIQITPTVESVKEFAQASYWRDWIGMETVYLHKIYWDWCIENGYEPINQQGFTRQLMKLYPHLKLVATRKKTHCCRVIRER